MTRVFPPNSPLQDATKLNNRRVAHRCGEERNQTPNEGCHPPRTIHPKHGPQDSIALRDRNCLQSDIPERHVPRRYIRRLAKLG